MMTKTQINKLIKMMNDKMMQLVITKKQHEF
mgnify:CR=1 FL=1